MRFGTYLLPPGSPRPSRTRTSSAARSSRWCGRRSSASTASGSPSITSSTMASPSRRRSWRRPPRCGPSACASGWRPRSCPSTIRCGSPRSWRIVDILSGGRLDVGVGRGNRPVEFEGYRVPQIENRERFEETLAILVKAWTKERFSYEGRHFTIPEVRVIPKPLQQPHPPLYVVCTSPDTIEATALRGLPMLNSLAARAGRSARPQRRHVREGLQKAGPQRGGDRKSAVALGRVPPRLRGAHRRRGAGRGQGRRDVVPGVAAAVPDPRAHRSRAPAAAAGLPRDGGAIRATSAGSSSSRRPSPSARPTRWPRGSTSSGASASARCCAG